MKTLLLFLISCCFIASTSVVQAQIDWNNPNLRITAYDGLPSTYYKDFEEDEFGFIWISTFLGVCRFDGSELFCLSDSLLPENGFTEIVYDKERKVLWIGTFVGLFSYDLLTTVVKHHHHNAPNKSREVMSLCLGPDNLLWVGTRTTLAKLAMNADTLENIVLDFDPFIKKTKGFYGVKSLHPDPSHEDRLWLSTSGGIIKYNWKENKAIYVDKEIGNKDDLGVNQIFSPTNSSHLYFGIDQHNTKKSTYNYLVYDTQTDQHVHSIALNEEWVNRKITSYQDSIIFFSTSVGLVKYNPFKNQISETILNKAKSSTTFKIDFVDSKSNIWAGNPQELAMYNLGNTSGKSYYYEADFPGWYHVASGSAIDTLNNKLYMAVFGGEGLYEFDLEKRVWKVYPNLDPITGKTLKTDFMEIVQFEPGKPSIIANSGIYILDESSRIIKSDFQIPENKALLNGYLDSRNVVWTTLSNGNLVKIDWLTKNLETLSSEIFYCFNATGNAVFYEDKNSNVWIGGYCGGFNLYERKTGKIYSFPNPKGENIAVISFAEKGDFIWAQKENGIILKINIHQPEDGVAETIDLKQRINNQEIQLLNRENFDVEVATSNNFDKKGRYWMLTNNGLYCYHPNLALVNFYDREVGINVLDPEMNVFVGDNLSLLPDGKMVFTNRKGICIFDPENISNKKETPKAYIKSISINNQEFKKDTSSFFKLNYQLGARENFVGFDFSALAFSSPLKTKYQYKLEGVDENWKTPGNKRFVSYTQLKGGQYTFQLKAAGAAGNWQENPVEISLQIAMLWYQTAWARGLFFASIIFGVLYTYFNRLNRAIEKEHLKTEYERDLAELKMQALTAQMNPHFIFNSLNSIDFYIIKNDTRKASKYLNRFSRLMRLILKNSRSNYVTLQDDIDALKLYLEIESLRFNHQFKYEINIADQIDLDYIKIPPMLIQPYVENSIWHGLLHKKENGKISINFKMDEEHETIQCIVIDNGIGRKKSMEAKTKELNTQKRKSFGMNITKDKIEAINFLHNMNAGVEITDLYDQNNNGIGTKVELSIPL